MFALRLPAGIETRLANLAKMTGRTKSFYVRTAIMEHLEELEDIYLAEKELEDIRAGRSKTTPLSQAAKEFGLES